MAQPETEELLLNIALHGTAAQVEKLVHVYRRSEAQEVSKEAQQQAARGLSYFYDDDGSLVLKGRLPAETGALLVKAIDTVVGNLFKSDPDTVESRPSFAARRADALGQIAESFLQHGLEAMSGADKHQIVVHVSAETLQKNVGGPCEFEHGPSLAAETARRLACDASIVLLTENERGEPLDVGRKTRSIPPALRRMLNARDKGCRFPGCCNTRFVDAHHIHHWAQGGETKPSNLITLCRHHHRKVHEGGIVIQVMDDGAVRFLHPSGESIDSVVPGTTPLLGGWTRLLDVHRKQGIDIDAKTAASRWQGESMDYSTAVQSMLFKTKHARNVSAETP